MEINQGFVDIVSYVYEAFKENPFYYLTHIFFSIVQWINWFSSQRGFKCSHSVINAHGWIIVDHREYTDIYWTYENTAGKNLYQFWLTWGLRSVTNWRPVQSVPRLSSNGSRDRLQHPPPVCGKWMDGLGLRSFQQGMWKLTRDYIGNEINIVSQQRKQTTKLTQQRNISQNFVNIRQVVSEIGPFTSLGGNSDLRLAYHSPQNGEKLHNLSHNDDLLS